MRYGDDEDLGNFVLDDSGSSSSKGSCGLGGGRIVDCAQPMFVFFLPIGGFLSSHQFF